MNVSNEYKICLKVDCYGLELTDNLNKHSILNKKKMVKISLR